MSLIKCGEQFQCFHKTLIYVIELYKLKDKILNRINKGRAVDIRNLTKLKNAFSGFEKEFFSAKVIKCLKLNCGDHFKNFKQQMTNTLNLCHQLKEKQVELKGKIKESHMETMKICIKFLERIIKKFESKYDEKLDNINLNKNFKNYVDGQRKIKEIEILVVQLGGLNKKKN